MQCVAEDWDAEIATGEGTAVASSVHTFNELTYGSTYGNTRAENRYVRGRGAMSRPNKRSDWRYRANRDGDSGPQSRGEPSLRINVANSSLGRLIGKGGQTIRELQSYSETRIKILKDEANLAFTPVEIIGNPTAQDCARRKIEELVEDLTMKRIRETTDNSMKQNALERPKIDWKALYENREATEQARWDGLPEIIKNFYEELSEVGDMTPMQVEEIRKEKNNISVQKISDENDLLNKSIPNPIVSFPQAFHNYPEILDTIYNQNFKTPSPIQCQSWPVLLRGNDLVGVAQTGTGKTLAFLLPALIHIDGQITRLFRSWDPRSERNGPSCLVLSPTRELAQQIEMEVRKFHYKGIRSLCIYGGGSRKQQIQAVEKGVEIVIGTPGRLNDLLMNGILSVVHVTFLVLDEADRMLDMGFEPEIKKIILDIRPDRQTVMTSATWPMGVQRMADQYLHNPIKVNVGSLDLQACHAVTQIAENIEGSNKKERVIEFINDMKSDDKLLIFAGKKITVDDISSDLVLRGIEIGVQTIHGDREQCDREQALEDFKTGVARVLIATDVASRGLDIKDITHVINYDFPRHIEEYVHRIGRTGRAGRSGTALTFVTREDWGSAHKLVNIMCEANQVVPDWLTAMADRYQAHRERMREIRQGDMESSMGRAGFRGLPNMSGDTGRSFERAQQGNFSPGTHHSPRRGRGRGRRNFHNDDYGFMF